MKIAKRFGLGTILIFSVLIYGSLWRAPALTWDDGSNIFANPYFTMHLWWGVWVEPYFGLYVPVTSSAWALLFWVGGGQTWPFRAFNLLLHLANISLVWVLLQGLAKRWKIASPVAVAMAVAIFAFHPLQVEAVAWISGARDLLSTFFALLAVLTYFRFRSLKGFAGATALFILALLSKPSVAILPIGIALLDWLLNGREGAGKKSFLKMASWCVFSGGAIYLTELAQEEHFTSTASWEILPTIESRLATSRVVPKPCSPFRSTRMHRLSSRRWLAKINDS